MFQALVDKSKGNIDTIMLLIDAHEAISVNEAAHKRHEIKSYSQASSLTRLYAVYESFIEKILSEYLDFLSENYFFSEMSEGFKKEYRLGISHLLSRIDQGRYNHLNHDDIVTLYYRAINNHDSYQFVNDALTRHEQNFRLNILENLFSRVGLEGFCNWLVSNRNMLSYYDGAEISKEVVESKIKEFVQLRNDASHGEIDNLISSEVLKDYCNFLISLIEAVREFLVKSIIDKMKYKEKLLMHGKVTESYRNNAVVIKLVASSNFSVGDDLYVVSGSSCFSTKCISIQLDSVDQESVKDLEMGVEVGVLCEVPIKKNSFFYKIE